jgi:tRNA (cytidine/uridine-2'-O-)-methyltransferase
MKVVLYQPQIPQNTGNIIRTCSVTGTELVLVTPLGFSLQDRWLKRAGLDYFEGVVVHVIDDLLLYLKEEKGTPYFFSSKAKKSYTEISYKKNDLLIFGAETTGLKEEFWQLYPDLFVKIPQKEGARCLNLATSVGVALFEAIRQTT